MATTHPPTPQQVLLNLFAEQDSTLVWSADSSLQIDRLGGGILATLDINSLESAAGQPVDAVFEQQADPEATLLAAHQTALGGETASCQFLWRGWLFDGRVMPNVDHCGTIIGCLGIAYPNRTIDELEKALEAAEQRFETLVGMSPAGIYMTDAAGRCTYVNRRWCEITGLTANQALGHCWLEAIHPEDRERVAESWRHAMNSTEVGEHTYRIITFSGKETWVLGQAKPLHSIDGQLIGYVGILVDVTQQKKANQELRESEQRFARLLKAVSSYRYCVLLDHGRPVATEHSPGCAATTGYLPEDYAHNPYLWIEMVHPEDRELVRAHIDNVLSSQLVPPIEHRIYHKNGSIIWVRTTIIPHVTSDGQLVRYDGLVEDITDRKLGEVQLRQREAQLVAAQKIQEHLLPSQSPNLPGFDIAGRVVPAHFAGGDHFDYLPLADGTLAVIVGDVSGHDVSAALVMASASAHFRSFAVEHSEVQEIIEHTNSLLAREMNDGMFVTLFVLQLDASRRTIRFANAGHPSGYVLNADGRIKATMRSMSFPLAVVDEAEFPVSKPIQLVSGDTILLITDGILEARNSDNLYFGDERLLDIAREHRSLSASAIIDAIQQAVFRFIDQPHADDDLTMVVIKVL